ncbi:6768_t:CDS:2, partial [Rhizophagus irregularis]
MEFEYQGQSPSQTNFVIPFMEFEYQPFVIPFMEFDYQGQSTSLTTFVTPLMEFDHQGQSTSQTNFVMPLMEFDHQGQSDFITPLIEFDHQSQSPFQTTNIVVIDDNENTNGRYNDENTNANKVILKVGNTFKDWNEVDVIINQYAKQNGFVAIKFRKDFDEVDKMIVRRRVYTCWKSGISKPKKVEDITLHRDATTTKTNCSWQASFNFGKRATAIHLTKFNNIHNHQCDPVTIELAPMNQRFPQVVLDKIEHYTINGHLSAGQQYDLLLKEFSQHHIKKKNLYNAIQKFWGVRIHDESDAAMMFSYLIEQRKMLTKYEPCRTYLEKKLYPSRESWARYAIGKVFTAGVESTQRVESINGVLKKHLDRGTLLKELVREVERKLDKESYYKRLNDYYGSNPTIGLPSAYNSIFKDIDSILKECLAPIPLSLQRAQMKQALLYQETLITIDQVNEPDNNPSDIVEYMYDMPQIRLQDLLSNLDNTEIQEIWEVSYITITSSTAKPHYVAILADATSFCTCMNIINQGMPCRHQYRILLQSDKAVFHMGFIHTRWFESMPSETSRYATIAQGNKTYSIKLLHYIDQIRTGNVYTSTIKKTADKKIEFGSAMSMAKTSVQIAVIEGATGELTGLLTQFIMKYRRATGLNIEEVQEEISNPEYHKPKGRSPKRYKAVTEMANKQNITSSSKTCSHCLEKGHNIRSCAKHKASEQ